jgi:hypothetical protein
VSLKAGVNRFSIRGKQSREIISKVFWPRIGTASNKEAEILSSANNLMFSDVINSPAVPRVWKNDVCLAINAIDVRALQIKSRCNTVYRENPVLFWRKIDDAEWRRRLRNSAGHKQAYGESFAPRIKWPPIQNSVCLTSQSALWHIESDIPSPISNFELNRKKKDLSSLTNGGASDLNAAIDFASIPVILVKKNAVGWNHLPNTSELCIRDELKPFSNASSSSGDKFSDIQHSGWDIILPEAWARQVWVSLQFAGARAISLVDAEQFQLECGMLSFPRDYPDTYAGIAYWERLRREHDDKSAKSPRKDRKSAFSGPSWNVLRTSDEFAESMECMKEVSDSSKQIVVVRNLAFLKPFIGVAAETRLPSSKVPLWRKLSCRTVGNQRTDRELHDFSPFEYKLPNLTLISIFLRPISRGVFLTGAQILGPIEDDTKSIIQNNRSYSELSFSPSRVCLGFVTAGGYSAVLGGEIAVGHCDAPRLHNSYSLMASLLTHGSSSNYFVLIQNPGQNNSFAAKLIVIPMN